MNTATVLAICSRPPNSLTSPQRSSLLSSFLDLLPPSHLPPTSRALSLFLRLLTILLTFAFSSLSLLWQSFRLVFRVLSRPKAQLKSPFSLAAFSVGDITTISPFPINLVSFIKVCISYYHPLVPFLLFMVSIFSVGLQRLPRRF